MSETRNKNKATSPILDLSPFSDRHDLNLTLNPAEHPSDAAVRRVKDVALFSVTLIFIVAVGGYCLYVVFARAGSPDDIKWATSMLTAIM